MTKYIDQEREKYWPVSSSLMAEYCDGTHTDKYAGDLYWRQNNQLHRDGDKPAYIGRDGYLEWFQNGQSHRLCGPAVIYPSGTLEWWINGKEITDEVNEWLSGKEWQGTLEQIFEFQLRFT